MILYFSGTGNSEYVAKQIAKETGDEVINLFERIRKQEFSQLHSERPWVLVAPTYAWRMPHIVEKWLEKTSFTGNKEIYFVMTCGGNIGNAGAYLEKQCVEKGMKYCGCAEIVMPENYIALFTTPEKEQALKIIEKAEGAIKTAAVCIKNGEEFSRPAISLGDRLSSGIVNDIFYPAMVHAKKFYATDDCISCGKCVEVCPLGNVSLKDGKPVWGNDCTHCMACICRCPKEAIEYGKHSVGLPRYTFPKVNS